MKVILPFFMFLILSSCNKSSTGSKDLFRPVVPGPVATEQAPPSEGQAPASEEQSPQSQDQVPESEPENQSVRNINGTITLLWNAIFPKAYASDKIHVYRFKTEREYEYLSSHEVSSEGKFSFDLDPAATKGYMLHLVLEEEYEKKGMREIIISGDFDQSIKLDSFETIKSQINLKWFFEQNVLRNESFADAASNPEDLKSMSAEDLIELSSIINRKFAESKEWDYLTKPEAFKAFKKVLDEDIADYVIGFAKGYINRDDFFGKIKNLIGSKNLFHFGSCAFRPMEQKIVVEDESMTKDKLDLRYVPLNEVAKKFIYEDVILASGGRDELFEFIQEIDAKIEHFRKNVDEEIHFRLLLVHEDTQSTDSCDYRY